MGRRAISLVGGFLLLCALSAEAQISTGSIFGAVRDESRAVLPGATVTAMSPVMPGGPVTAVTNERGEYRLRELQPGIYRLRVELQGFARYEEADIRVIVAGTVERNVTLPLATVAETITVSGEAPTVDTRNTGVVANITKETVINIPIPRNGMGSYVTTLAGVSPDSFNKQSSVRVAGSQAGEVSYNVDGVMSNSITGGGTFNFGEIDAVEEVNVQLLSPSAEFQRASGGVLNVVTKSGTNRFMYDAMGYWQPKNLVSTPFKLPCRCPEGETGYKFYLWRDYNFHASGPIVKDRLWFHTGMSSRGFLFRNPGAPDIPKQYQWNRFDAGSNTKFTWRINQNNTFKQNFYYEWYEYNYPESPTFLTPLESVAWYPGDIWDTASELTTVLSSSRVLTSRFTHHFYPSGWQGFGPSLTRKDGATPGRIDTFTGRQSGNINAQQSFTAPSRDELAFKLNQYVSNEKLNHNIRGGFQYVWTDFLQQNLWAGGAFYRDYNGQPDEAIFAGPSVQAAATRNWGIWAEDELNIGQRVTIQPGFRFDQMRAVSPDVSLFDISKPFTSGILVEINQYRTTGETVRGLGNLFTQNVVSPRLGVNVKVTEDGKTILRGAVGRFYRPIDMGSTTTGLPAVHPAVATQTLSKWNPATQAYSSVIAVTVPNANLRVDPNTKAQYTDQYSIGIDRELMANTALSVSYVHKEGRDQAGLLEVAGTYGADTVTLPDIGRTLPVYRLMTPASARIYRYTNPSQYFLRYNGFVSQITKRYANRWTALVGYSYGKLTTVDGGTDPNEFTNREGASGGADRPNMFKVAGTWQVPKVEVQLSGNFAVASGLPYGSQAAVVLPQGRTLIYIDPPGTYRAPRIDWMHFRATKILFRHANRYLELGTEIRNVFNEESNDHVSTQVYNSPNFGKPAQWAYPRQVMFMSRVFF